MSRLSTHFTSEEFACRCGCGFNDVSPELLHLLEAIREEYGKPMHINSGCRCKYYNHSIGGATLSAHLPNEDGECEAADIHVPSGRDRRKLLDCSVMLFASGIGIANTFVHVDTAPEIPGRIRPNTWPY